MDVTISISVRQQRFPSRIIKEHFLLLLLKDRVMKTRHSSIFTLWGAATVVHVRSYNRLLHICFDRFLLAFESRDLSQADNSIIRVSSFPSWVMGSRTFFSVSTTEPWTFCKMNALNPLKFTSHKKNWENWGKKLKLIKTSILPNFQVPNSFFL